MYKVLSLLHFAQLSRPLEIARRVVLGNNRGFRDSADWRLNKTSAEDRALPRLDDDGTERRNVNRDVPESESEVDLKLR
jgi:hypothetical protein